MKSTVAKVAVYIYLYSVLEMYVKQYTVLTGTSTCQLLFLKEACIRAKIPVFSYTPVQKRKKKNG
jgi:hypothetical protein